MYVLCVCLDENKEMMKNGSLKKRGRKRKREKGMYFNPLFFFYDIMCVCICKNKILIYIISFERRLFCVMYTNINFILLIIIKHIEKIIGINVF